nr:hypothetical protein [Tanacetum cinerariifolium]
MAFVSSSNNNTNSSNEAVNTAFGVTTTGTQVNIANINNLSDAIFCTFLASQPSSPELVNEDLEQIHPDDLEDMDLKWQMAMLTIRARRFLKNTGKKLNLNGNETVAFDKTKVKCYNFHKRGYFARECRAPRAQEGMCLLKLLTPQLWCLAMDLEVMIGVTKLQKDLTMHLWHTLLQVLILSETTDKKPVVETSEAKACEDKPKFVRNNCGPLINEDLKSDDEDGSVPQPKIEKKTVKPSFAKIEQKFSKEVVTVNTAGPVNTAHPKTTINAAKPRVNTVRNKNVNTARPKAVLNAVKAHSTNEFTGMLDSGFSRHMTGNMSYQRDYKEIDEGYVSFGEPVADKVVNEEMDDSLERDTTTATRLDEIDSLKRRVKKLEKKQRSKTHKIKRLYKVGVSARVQSCKKEGLSKEDASKQGRIIDDLDFDEDITLLNDQEMFDADKDLQGDEVVVKQEVVADKESSADAALVSAATTTTINDITLAKALKDLKTSKPKNKRSVIKDHEEPSESKTTTIISLKKSKDKGKVKMIEEPLKLKKKYQTLFDEEVARKLQEEINEQERLVGERARKEEEANIALIKTWEDIQAKLNADYQLAERMQAEEQQELNEEEKAKLFMKLLEKRRKLFAAKRAKEKRNRSPTKAQQRSLMYTYLKNIDGWKTEGLKNKSFAEIQELFNKAMKRINNFVDFRTELVEKSTKKNKAETVQESSLKRTRNDMIQESSKK